MSEEQSLTWLTPVDAATRLGKSRSLIWQWAKEGCTQCRGTGCEICHDGMLIRKSEQVVDGRRKVVVCFEDCLARQNGLGGRKPYAVQKRNGGMTVTEFATAVGVSESRARQMKMEGKIGAYSPDEAERINLLRIDADPRSDHEGISSDDLRNAKARKEYYQAESERLKYEKTAGKLIDADVAMSVVEKIGDICRSEINGLVHSLPFSIGEEIRGKVDQDLLHEIEAAVRAHIVGVAADTIEKIASMAEGLASDE